MSVDHKYGNLFSVKEGLLVHACNMQGVWGSGVAKVFKAIYPSAFASYKIDCLLRGKSLRGTCSIFEGIDASVGCLYTSFDYGPRKDSEELILQATIASVSNLLMKADGREIHSPKINSGLFGVEWLKTEKIINNLLAYFPGQKWTVWELP